MSDQIQRMSAMIEGLAVDRSKTDRRLAKAARREAKRNEYTEGASGVEPWVTEAILANDLKQTHKWWSTDHNQWESPRETIIRNRVYQHMKTQIPKDLYSQCPQYGDVKSIYLNIISMGKEESSAQILSLEAELSSTTKAGKSMITWLNALYEIFSQLSILEHPRTVAQIRLQIYQSLKSDSRYEHVVRDIKRNTAWSIVKIRSALEAHATSINDLLEGPSHKAEIKRLAKVAYRQARTRI